jgi:hypothetical protein
MTVANFSGETPPLQRLRARRRATRGRGPKGRGLELPLHFLPNAAFLLPVVKRFAIDFMNGRFRNC